MLYIDPGTGSMLFSVLISLFALGYFAFRGVLLKLRLLPLRGINQKVFKELVCHGFDRHGLRQALMDQMAALLLILDLVAVQNLQKGQQRGQRCAQIMGR